MTMRTSEYFVCPNNHQGKKTTSENDQPYSKMWEKVSMNGIEQGAKDTNGQVTYLCTVCGLQMTRC